MKTRVKICGITSTKDAQSVCDAGVDAIGLVFYEKSPRNVSIQQGANICASLPPFVNSVGLFLDAPAEFVNSVLASVPLDLLQFHGSETPDYCAAFNRPYIKAVGMKNMQFDDFSHYADQFTEAKGFLVDSHGAGKAGGTGETFDWSNVPQDYDKPVILAGGLNPENVADALKQLDIYGIDLSSGVESTPGKKDEQKIIKLMEEVKRVQCEK
jgi:phosphoribosylanthranilate isomerase